ncbi:autolysin (amidase) [Listeria floridensis FSL S10-1187]|uniref:Autolysin (Amidase) n=1 Tax=Listeria floridensis FSL S10-1187 TaxID=1265817 RepID=A0ABN0RG34_9LIST|nr:GW dipeptide domain-containing protein [Listeria floridensis]EUJ32789.1 autolysin (amidase) [Listeria floridensis FSL S10-1187]
MKKIANLLQKGIIGLFVLVIVLASIPQKGNATYSQIISESDVHYSMEIIKTDITYNIFKDGPYNTSGSTKLVNSITYVGKPLQAVKEKLVDDGRTWINFQDLEGNEIGWIDKRAIKQGADFRVITSSKDVNYAMMIKRTEILYNVFKNGPHNTPNASLLTHSSTYIGKEWHAVKEVVTDNERTWVHFKGLDGKEIGWVDKNVVEQGKDYQKIMNQKDVNYMATINSDQYQIHKNGPDNTPNSSLLSSTKGYLNATFQIRREVVTSQNETWLWLWSFEGSTYKEFGWVNKRAVKQNIPYIVVDKEVSSTKILSKKGSNDILGDDVNVINGTGTNFDSSAYVSKTVHVLKERTLTVTSTGKKFNLSYINIDGKDLGWIESKYLTDFLNEQSTVTSIENALLKYLEMNHNGMEINTDKFVEFAFEQLEEDKDEDLALREDYEVISAYLSEYINACNEKEVYPELADATSEQEEESADLDVNLEIEEVTNKEDHTSSFAADLDPIARSVDHEIIDYSEAAVKVNPSLSPLNEEKDKTIGEVIGKAVEEEIENNDLEVSEDELMRKGYNRNRAIAYAKKWYKQYNQNYRRFGSDCTNFVSQCIYNGGKPEKVLRPVPCRIYSTTKYWYSQHVYIKTYYTYKTIQVSTPWINVSDFASYWSGKQPVRSFTNVNSAISYARPGDVIQFRKKGAGRYFHSTLAVSKSGGTLRLASHTSSYFNRSIRDIMQQKAMKGASIRVIRF